MMNVGQELRPAPAVDWLSGLLRIRPVVLDTGPLTCDVISLAKSRSSLPSPLLAAMQFGVLRGFAASHVWAEVPRTLYKRASGAGVPIETLEAIWWNDYVPLIRFVDCTGLPMTDEALTLARRDQTDTATLVLAGLLAPVVILAEDRDIVASGLAYEQWRDFYEVARTIRVGGLQLRLMTNVVVFAGQGLVGTGRAVLRAARNPWLIAAAALGRLLLYRSSGSWAPRLQPSWQQGAASRGVFREAFGEMLTLAAARIRWAQNLWSDAERGIAGDALLHRTARVLATVEGPMTRSELVAELALDNRRAAMALLADLLRGRPAFHEAARGRWQLGRERVDFGGLPRSLATLPWDVR